MSNSILVVDGTQTVSEMVRIALAGFPAEVTFTGHTVGARESIEASPPALIVLRSRLSDGSGQALVEALQANEATAAIPIIVLRGRNEQLDENLMPTSLALPFKTQELVRLVSASLAVEPPDEALYKPFMVEIPLARPAKVPENSPVGPPPLRPLATPNAPPIRDEVTLDQLLAKAEQEESTDAHVKLQDGVVRSAPVESTLLTKTSSAQTVESLQTVDMSMDEIQAVEAGMLTINEPDFARDERAGDTLLPQPSIDPPTKPDAPRLIPLEEAPTDAFQPERPVTSEIDIDRIVGLVLDALEEGKLVKSAVGSASLAVI